MISTVRALLTRPVAALVMVAAGCLSACRDETSGFTPVSEITRNGFGLPSAELRRMDGEEVLVWGFVDYGNVYGDEGAREILGEWWSGPGPRAGSWRFDVKARDDDPTGKSFAVHVPNAAGRDELLEAFVENARAGRPTRVFVKGSIHTFDAATQGTTLTGLFIEVTVAQEIFLAPPADL